MIKRVSATLFKYFGELIHCSSLSLFRHLDIRLHGFVVAVTSPFHNNMHRDSGSKDVANERLSASMGADNLPFRVCKLVARSVQILDDGNRFIKLE